VQKAKPIQGSEKISTGSVEWPLKDLSKAVLRFCAAICGNGIGLLE
jgi:hypothetical protein